MNKSPSKSQSFRRTHRTKKVAAVAAASSFAIAGLAGSWAKADSLVWDPSAAGASGSDASGSWNVTTTNKVWYDPSALPAGDVYWNADGTAATDAVAIGAGGTSRYNLTLANTVNVESVTFDQMGTAGGYNITGGTALAFTASSPTVTDNNTNATSYISSPITSTNGLSVSTAGALTFSGIDTIIGNFSVTGAGSMTIGQLEDVGVETIGATTSATGATYVYGGLNISNGIYSTTQNQSIYGGINVANGATFNTSSNQQFFAGLLGANVINLNTTGKMTLHASNVETAGIVGGTGAAISNATSTTTFAEIVPAGVNDTYSGTINSGNFDLFKMGAGTQTYATQNGVLVTFGGLPAINASNGTMSTTPGSAIMGGTVIFDHALADSLFSNGSTANMFSTDGITMEGGTLEFKAGPVASTDALGLYLNGAGTLKIVADGSNDQAFVRTDNGGTGASLVATSGGSLLYVMPSTAVNSTNGWSVASGTGYGVLGANASGAVLANNFSNGYSTTSILGGNIVVDPEFQTTPIGGGAYSWAAINNSAGHTSNVVPLTIFATDAAYNSTLYSTNEDVPASGATAAASAIVNTLRFNGAGGTVTVSGTNSTPLEISSGGILVTPSVGANATNISGGAISAGAGNYLTTGYSGSGNGVGSELFVNQYNTNVSGAFTISSNIVDNLYNHPTGTLGSALVKTGGGTLILTGINTYGGTTFIDQGSLEINSTTALPSGGLLTLSGGVLGLGPASGYNSSNGFTRTIGVGTGDIEALASGGGFASYNGTIQVTLFNSSGGTNLGWGATGGSTSTGAQALSTFGNAFMPEGAPLMFGAIDSTGTINFTDNIALNLGVRTVSVTRGGGAGAAAVDAILSGVISDTSASAPSGISGFPAASGTANIFLSGLTKEGTGVLELSGANTYTGPTTVNAGTLIIGDGTTHGTLSASSPVINNATVMFNRSDNIAQGTNFGSIGITGTGTLIQGGTGNLTLNSVNTYTGPTQVNSGTLTLANNAGTVLTSSPITVGGAGSAAALAINGNNTIGGNLTLSGNDASAGTGTLSLVGGNLINTLTLANNGTSFNLGGSTTPSILDFDLTSTGADSIALGSTDTFNVSTGGAYVNLTTTALLTSNTYPLITFTPGESIGTGAVTFTGGSLTSTADGATLTLSNTSTGIYLTVSTTAIPTIAYFKGGISGNWNDSNGANFTSDSAGTTPLTQLPVAGTDVHFYATNAVTTATTLGANFSINSLVVDGNSLGESSAVSIAPGGAFSLTLDAALGVGINVSNGAGAVTISAPIILGAAQSWTNNSANPMTISGTVTNGGFGLNIAGSGNTSIGSAITGAGALNVSSSGLTTLSGSSTYTGGTVLSAGTTRVAATEIAGTSGPLGASGTITFNGGILQFSSSDTFDYSSRFSTAANQAIAVDTNGQTVSFAAALTASGDSLTKYGSGTLTLSGSGANTNLSANVSAGTLVLAKTGGASAVAGNLIIGTGAIVQLSGTGGNEIADTANVSVMGTLDVNGSTGPTSGSLLNLGEFIGQLSGTGTVTNSNSSLGILNIGKAGAGNGTTFSGNLQDGGGPLGMTINTGYTLSGHNTYSGPTTIVFNTLSAGVASGSGFGAFGNNSAMDIGTGNTGAGTGAGGIDLKGFNTSIGSLASGILLGSGMQYGGNVNLDSANLTIDGVNGSSVDFSGQIFGTGSVTKAGSGTQSLSGSNNNYTGGTYVTGGTLALVSTGAIPTTTTLNISGGAFVSLNHSSGTPTLTEVSALNNSGLIDITNNDFVLQNGGSAGLASLSQQVKSGYNNGPFNGSTGITSSAAQGNQLTAIGVILNTADGTHPLYGTGGTISSNLDGVTSLTATDVLTKYTYYGDANLDGVVDGSDYSRIDGTYLTEQSTSTAISGWFNGDFNYDGVVDGSDYTLIDNAFNSQAASLEAEVATPTAEISSSAAVPEPTTLGLLGIGAVGLLGRRRRRN